MHHKKGHRAVEKMGAVCGYILQHMEEKTLYIAGDTIYYDEVEQILLTQQPDIVVLNCCAATTVFGRLIMHDKDVAQVCRAVPDATVIASHMDSVNHALIFSDDLRRFAKEHQLSRLHVPVNGEVMEY